MRYRYPRDRMLFRSRQRRGGFIALEWPKRYAMDGTHFPADQLLAGFRSVGIPVNLGQVPQPAESPILTVVATIGDQRELIAFDFEDSQEAVDDLVESALVYFKFQHALDGYESQNVVPGGYLPANVRIYRYLRVLRAIRSLQLFRYDVYCRLGLRYGGQEDRIKAHEILAARTDFRYEGSLFRYPGGPEKVPYRKYLFEIPRSKVCVDIPGNGDFTTRLVDYLAIGACVVKPPPQSRFPVQPIDGVHVVYCASDLSDLGDVCAQLVRDDKTREAISLNARAFFDRHLRNDMLAQRYVDAVTDARSAVRRPRPTGAIIRTRESARPLAVLAAAGLAALLTFVALPEALGDRPYDPRPSDLFEHHR